MTETTRQTPADAPTDEAVAKERSKRSDIWRKGLQQGLAFGTLVALLIFFSIASNNFFTWSNISGVLLATAVIGILALGTTFVITTGGIDVGAKEEIYRLLQRLAENGKSIIVISSELPEVLGIADRVIVMRDGRISGELDRSHASETAALALALPDGAPAAPVH